MLHLPTPPAPRDPATVVPTVLQSVWHGVVGAVGTAPWIVPMAALLVLFAFIRLVRKFLYPSGRRDRVRLFAAADKAAIVARAGGRCERHSMISGRCRAIDRLEADHVIPWSRGGRTVISNGQALCTRHNRAKAASIPFAWQRRALDKRPSSYQ